MKNKGFVIEGTLAIIFLISAATLAVFTLTPAKNLVNLGGGDGQKTTQKINYRETMEPYTEDGKPVKVKLSDGSEGLIFKRVVSNETLDEQVIPKKTIWQKLKELGWWWIALTIAGMFFAPLGLVMNKINEKAKKAALAIADQLGKKHADLATEAQRIVLSVDEGLNVFDAAIKSANASVDAATQAAAITTDPQMLASHNAIRTTYQAVSKALTDTKAAFLDALKTKQDESTKLLVSKLRSGSPTI
jgi:hypothetical protein